MPNRYQILEAVLFVDFLVGIESKDFNPDFDLDYSLITDLDSYCETLFNKLFTLKHSEIPDFLDHQCTRKNNPMLWLNKLEKLVEVNSDLFVGGRNESRKTKLYTCIELKRKDLKSDGIKLCPIKPNQKYINAQCEDRYFCFKETKAKADALATDAEKILFLTQEVFEYKGSYVDMISSKLPTYDKECEKYIMQIQTMSKLKLELEEENGKTKTNIKTLDKIRLHGPLNILTNAFKQMMTDVKPTGLPYIQNKIKDIALFICENFEDENGNPISKDTVQTYLSSNRSDKDPNSDNSVKL